MRVPKPLFATYSGDDRYVMVLEDLEASGCRFPTQDDPDIEFRARDIVEQLAVLHARYWETRPVRRRTAISRGSRRRRRAAATAARSSCRWPSTRYADRLPDGFRPLAEFYLAALARHPAAVPRGAAHARAR